MKKRTLLIILVLVLAAAAIFVIPPMLSCRYYGMAKTQYDSTAYSEAIDLLQKSLKFDKKNIEARLLRADIHLQFERNEEALTDYAFVLQETDTSAVAHMGAAVAHYRQEAYEKTLQQADAALQLTTLPEGYLYKGLANLALKRFDEAESAFTQAIEQDATFAEAYHYRGIAKANQGNFEEAAADYN